jgi:UDP-GlcNAc:undecaprenyl-phosphate GlcNAc-1-phosphate transferase
MEYGFMAELIITIVASFILSIIMVSLVLRLSHIKSWYDRIDERKIHTGDVPRLGGVGFALAFIVSAAVIIVIAKESYFGLRFVPVLVAMFLIMVIGVRDDFRPLTPRNKLYVQILSALCVVIPDYTFHRLFFFDIGPMGDLGWIRFPLSVFWIVGLTNAVNFIDGVDGLAGGVSALIALTYAVIFTSFANTGTTTLLCVCLVAVIAGFLIFNMPFPKARIFMGDGGAYFLGFILAVLPLIDRGNSRSDLPLPYAAALLLIPIFDTVAAVWRRLRDGRRIDSPDRSHIHHKLKNLGLTDQGVDGLLYSLQIVLGVLVFLSVKFHGVQSLIFLGSAYLIGIVFFAAIHYLNRIAANRFTKKPVPGIAP